MAKGAGRLDQRITFSQLVVSDDGAGGKTKSWQSIASVWAATRFSGGKEMLSETRDNATATVDFTIRMRQDIYEADKITWNGVDWNIRTIAFENGRNLYLKITAERGVPA